MRVFVYVIRDSVSQVYDRPMCARSEGEMVRSFSDVAKDTSHPIGQHPEHYSLWNVGTYDDNSGMIEATPPVHVVNAIDLVRGDLEVVGDRVDGPSALEV